MKQPLLYFFYGKAPYFDYSRKKALTRGLQTRDLLIAAVALDFSKIESLIHDMHCSDTGYIFDNPTAFPETLTDLNLGRNPADLDDFMDSVWKNDYTYVSNSYEIRNYPSAKKNLHDVKFNFLKKRAEELEKSRLGQPPGVGFDRRLLTVEILIASNVDLNDAAIFVHDTLHQPCIDQMNRHGLKAKVFAYSCDLACEVREILGALNGEILKYYQGRLR